MEEKETWIIMNAFVKREWDNSVNKNRWMEEAPTCKSPPFYMLLLALQMTGPMICKWMEIHCQWSTKLQFFKTNSVMHAQKNH
jgi:hypothetical protein